MNLPPGIGPFGASVQRNPLLRPHHQNLGLFSDSDSGCAVEEFSWTPPSLSVEQIHKYFSSLPDHKVPFSGSVGEEYRNRQLIYQLPPQDYEPKYCSLESEVESNELIQFREQRTVECVGRGQVKVISNEPVSCRKCLQVIHIGDLGVFASRAGPTGIWHPQCFTCADCLELLVDLIYFHHSLDDNLYCGRHHAEKWRPRCAACDQLVFSTECTEAEGFVWHVSHFMCYSCDALLAGSRYILKDSKPYCLTCYDTSLAENCASCGKKVTSDQVHTTAYGIFYHLSVECFKCLFCNRPLDQSDFLAIRGSSQADQRPSSQSSSVSNPTRSQSTGEQMLFCTSMCQNRYELLIQRSRLAREDPSGSLPMLNALPTLPPIANSSRNTELTELEDDDPVLRNEGSQYSTLNTRGAASQPPPPLLPVKPVVKRRVHFPRDGSGDDDDDDEVDVAGGRGGDAEPSTSDLPRGVARHRQPRRYYDSWSDSSESSSDSSPNVLPVTQGKSRVASVAKPNRQHPRRVMKSASTSSAPTMGAANREKCVIS